MKISAVLLALALSSVESVRISNSAVQRILSGKGTGKDSGKGSGKGSGKASGGTGDPCDICYDGRPDSITFKYVPTDPGPTVFEKHTCALYMTPFPATASLMVKDKSDNVLFSDTVVDGQMFTVTGPFDADSFFQFVGFSGLDEGGDTCIVHTSCSDVILPGYENRIGPFEIINDNCNATPDECVICDTNNKVRPSPLRMQYTVNGQNSVHQTRATCVAGTYPPLVDITVSDKDGNVQEVITGVQDGDVIEIGKTYELDSNTFFKFNGLNDCSVHTSCSQPLVVNDVIGPFKLLAGNECDPEKCVVVDKTSYICDENIVANFDLTSSSPAAAAMRDDWIGFYPCDETVFFHAAVWQWTCGTRPTSDFPQCVPTSSGALTFDGLPDYNMFGPNPLWPLPPGCWKAVVLRNDGPSVPPYVPICESESFQVTC